MDIKLWSLKILFASKFGKTIDKYVHSDKLRSDGYELEIVSGTEDPTDQGFHLVVGLLEL